MALSNSSLSSRIRAKFIADATTGAIDGEALTAFCDAVAAAVVEELQAKADVLPGTLTAPEGGGALTGKGVVA